MVAGEGFEPSTFRL